MKRLDFKNGIRTVGRQFQKNSPKIMIWLGIGGMISTIGMAIAATPKSMKLIQEEQERKKDDGEEFTRVDAVKVGWKPYIPTIITGGLSVCCILASDSINTRRTAALATAYNLSREALKDYKDAVIETIGENKEKKVREIVAQKKIDEDSFKNKEVYITERGNALCYDSTSGRYFRSSVDQIKRAENEINFEMRQGNYASLNELYEKLGLRPTSIGNELGWNITRDGILTIDYDSALAEDDTPCLVLTYDIPPQYNYNKTW